MDAVTEVVEKITQKSLHAFVGPDGSVQTRLDHYGNCGEQMNRVVQLSICDRYTEFYCLLCIIALGKIMVSLAPAVSEYVDERSNGLEGNYEFDRLLEITRTLLFRTILICRKTLSAAGRSISSNPDMLGVFS